MSERGLSTSYLRSHSPLFTGVRGRRILRSSFAGRSLRPLGAANLVNNL
jgi:hypothetical protein